MSSQVQVRLARVEDKAAIVAFCQNTFSWGDYIADAWERWLADAGGRMLVGLVDERPVSVMHVALLGEMAWLEGMRVHPEFRRHGIASALEAAGRAVAREHGCRVARLATSIKNIAAQGLLDTIGYCRAAQFNEWEIEPAPGDFSFARIANPDDLAFLGSCWRDAEMRAASHSVLPNRQWSWVPLDEPRWREQIRAGEVRVASRGFSLLLAFEERDWSGLVLHALVGDEETMYALALAARGETAYRGFARLEAQIADHPTVNRALERAGFTRGDGMFVYEMEL
jgi:GNAT superfamily N-acetyltransferase